MTINKCWIARTVPGYYDEDYVERKPSRLFLFYDKPNLVIGKADEDFGSWNLEDEIEQATNISRYVELPNYFFPEIQMGECIEFRATKSDVRGTNIN